MEAVKANPDMLEIMDISDEHYEVILREVREKFAV